MTWKLTVPCDKCGRVLEINLTMLNSGVLLVSDSLAAENRVLKRALRMASGELSTHIPHTLEHPEEVYDSLIAAAEAAKEK